MCAGLRMRDRAAVFYTNGVSEKSQDVKENRIFPAVHSAVCESSRLFIVFSYSDSKNCVSFTT